MKTLVVIGMGHIGGSVASAAMARKLFDRVHGVESDPDHRTRAKERSLAHEVTEALPPLPGATLVVVAVPPLATAEVAAAALAACPDAAVTDVAGVKGTVLERVRALAPSHASRFVGGHPMAGTARSGPDAADPSLFERRTVVVCGEPETDPVAVAAVERLWTGLGASVLRETAAAHDRAIAMTSHLPHLLAFALVRAARAAGDAPGRDERAAYESVARFAGPSFESATRVAASNPGLWTELLLANRTAVVEALPSLHAALRDLESAVSTGNAAALRERLAEARALKTGEAAP